MVNQKKSSKYFISYLLRIIKFIEKKIVCSDSLQLVILNNFLNLSQIFFTSKTIDIHNYCSIKNNYTKNNNFI